MGTDFKNEFSWSTSRDKLFGRCLRAYWWRYYAHWGGWGRDAPEEARIAYRLGKLDSFATWGGTIVHDLIEGSIKGLRDRGRPIDGEALREQARARLREGWVQSRDGHWRQDPKRKLNLWEHYYGDPEDRTKERTDAVADKVYTCLQGFVDGPFPELLARLPKDAWRNVEALDSMQIDGRKVYVKPDLAFVHPDDGMLWLVDWKTGRPRDVDDFQVATYALFGQHKWGVEPGQARGVLVYLAEGEQKEFALEEPALEAARERIRGSMEQMLALLEDPEDNAGRIASFPQTDNRRECTFCAFKQLCFGGAGVPGAALARDGI